MVKLISILFLHLIGGALSHGHVEEPAFGYHGLRGPVNWYALNKTANSMCALGKHQSPINLIGTSCTSNAPTISIDPQPEGAEFVNLGTTVEVPVNGTLTNQDGKIFQLRQFHFHTPSEHSVDEEHSSLEVHFVFQAEGMIIPSAPALPSRSISLYICRWHSICRGLPHRARPTRQPLGLCP